MVWSLQLTDDFNTSSSLSSLPSSLILQLQMANITSHGLRLNVAYMKKEQVEKIMMKIGGTGKGSSSSSFSLEIPTLSCYGE